MTMRTFFCSALCVSLYVLVSLIPHVSLAQAVLHQELQETVPATVIEIKSVTTKTIPGTDTVVTIQDVRAQVQGGLREQQVVTFENELVTLAAGDKIFVNRLVSIGNEEYWQFKDVDRRPALTGLSVLFVVLLLWFAGWQGGRALLSLGISILAILYLLVPALLAGYNPALASLGIASLILAIVLFGTHGFTARSTIAFIGTSLAVVVTCLIAWWFVSVMQLTGFGSDAAVYLNFSTKGTLDFAGLLLGSIIIGMLGVLDDVSITQASVVQELKSVNLTLSRYELYRRAIRVGRDHVGSLVNTLALAYVGAALPLVLLLARAESDVMLSLNQEIVAAEIVRIIVGSIGLILAVPFTTMIASWWFGRTNLNISKLADGGHTHHHS